MPRERLPQSPRRRADGHAGKTRVTRETRSLADVNEAIADFEAGRDTARVVLQP